MVLALRPLNPVHKKGSEIFLFTLYLELCQRYLMELFAKMFSGFHSFTIITKSSILDLWQSSEYASEIIKLVLRCSVWKSSYSSAQFLFLFCSRQFRSKISSQSIEKNSTSTIINLFKVKKFPIIWIFSFFIVTIKNTRIKSIVSLWCLHW